MVKSERRRTFKTSTAWRQWLARHHKSSDPIWIIHFKGDKKKGVTHQEATREALCFGWIDGQLRRIDETSYAIRYSPRTAKSVWSKINKDLAMELIAQGRMTKTGQDKIEEAKKNGLWVKAYTSKIPDPLPLALKRALKSNMIAWKHFQSFATTYRNMYAGWVASAKMEETKRKRIAKVVSLAERNIKSVYLQ